MLLLKATDVLMARDGVKLLSTHKIAKEAGVSVGTIYLYFKDKDDLLNRLVHYLFEHFHGYIEARHDSTLPLFEQYSNLWWSHWSYLQDNPTVVLNHDQYNALPEFQKILENCMNNDSLSFHRFLADGKKQGVLVDLPFDVLYSMSIATTWDLMHKQLITKTAYPEAILEQVIARTWKAISI